MAWEMAATTRASVTDLDCDSVSIAINMDSKSQRDCHASHYAQYGFRFIGLAYTPQYPASHRYVRCASTNEYIGCRE